MHRIASHAGTSAVRTGTKLGVYAQNCGSCRNKCGANGGLSWVCMDRTAGRAGTTAVPITTHLALRPAAMGSAQTSTTVVTVEHAETFASTLEAMPHAQTGPATSTATPG
jgi:hypothetical protein